MKAHTPLSPCHIFPEHGPKRHLFLPWDVNGTEKSAWTELEPPFQISANSLNVSTVQSLPWAKPDLQKASVKHINEFLWNNYNLTHYQLLI